MLLGSLMCTLFRNRSAHRVLDIGSLLGYQVGPLLCQPGRSAHMAVHMSEPQHTINTCSVHLCMHVGAYLEYCLCNRTLSKLYQKAIKEKELNRKSCVTSFTLISPSYVKMNVLN
ncbi:hypothetical protein HanRHA438_Chr16g0744431 [Helianthus annuus]|nr:hypothetical protein HanRHA438_Chr16g0744431 [Helianthus annuus]